MSDNIILKTDSYKVTHAPQYPPGTTKVYSFFESRGGDYPTTLFFGLQYYLKKYMVGQVVTREKIEEAEPFFKAHFGKDVFNREGWEYILEKYDGHLPLKLKAVPEGSIVPFHNVLMTLENTDPKLWWLTNYLETMLVKVWYPTTVATQSRFMKDTLLTYLKASGDPSSIDFKLHDFGYRGSTSEESAGIGGLAHLVNFKGTDTMEALVVARDYYSEPMAGFSIPAAEHSTITSWGRDNEVEAYRNMLIQFPEGLLAVVSDSFNVYEACKELWGKILKDEVLARDGVLVIRPDSGDPPTVVVKVLEILGKQFGYTKNAQGYKVLNPKVRIIQGDGIDPDMLEKILWFMTSKRWSADNIAFGSGGGLLQKVNRDTLRFAFKCSAIEQGGKWFDVMKDPITDSGKRSKAGRLVLTKNEGVFTTVTKELADSLSNTTMGTVSNYLETVFENGKLIKEYTLQEIRDRAQKG